MNRFVKGLLWVLAVWLFMGSFFVVSAIFGEIGLVILSVAILTSVAFIIGYIH